VTTDNQQQQQAPADPKPADQSADPAPAKSAAEIAAEQAANPKPLADAGLAKLGEGYLKDGQPDFEKIAADLARAHQDVPGEGADYTLAFPETFDLKGADGEVIKLALGDPAKRSGVVGSDLGISGASKEKFQAAQRASIERANEMGRWPANVIHDGSDEVLDAFPNAPGQMASTSSSRKTQNVYGEMRRGNGRENEPSADSDNDGAVGFKMKPGARRLDSGSAARFFYCAKASKKDRGEGNVHPTVKPTDLMRHLCRLATPAGGVVLDPVMGSGSTLKAADLEGFSAIGIELSAEYIEIARRRIASDAPLFANVEVA